ncbi:helix-turn-helix transcriptional regulator [Streptomyces sp. NPDC032198]|uniref:helix-turn-helix domain-containing protein n=1 Tax=Streptomyces sp. NPDC032198 TaxID=3155127 RepID=UPI0033DA07EE
MGENVGAGDLADLLRELKERSGLSYGSLAKRLHVSTSTLHRYVNGSAVPTEFAPLERLARACGASREQMVEVHRRWILADASRGDRKEGEPPARGAATDPVKAPAAGTAASGSDEGSDVGPDVGSDVGPSDSASDEAPDIVIGPARAAAGKREGRRLTRARVLVAAGAILALGATAVAVQAASGDGDRDRDGDRAAVNSPSPYGGERERSPDGSGSESPSAKESGKGKQGEEGTGSDTSRGDDKGVGGGTGGPAAGDGGKGGTATGKGAPVTVSVQPQYWADPCGHPYLVNKSPGTLSPPPNEQDAASWVAANGAVSARDQTVKLTVQGKGKETVVLESLNVRVVGTSAPLTWTNYKMGYLGVGCGGNIPQRSFAVNLDAAVPRPTPLEGDSGFPYKVNSSDPEAFFIDATANTRYVRWYLELDWSSGTRHGTVRIDDTGKPFATSGDKDRPVYGFSLNSKKWTKTNRDNDDVPDPPA